VANCDRCTAATVVGCTKVTTGFYVLAGAISACNSDFTSCFNSGTGYQPGESCKYGSLSAYNAGAWVSACQIGAPAGNCAKNFRDSSFATKCAQCNTNFYLELTGFTCVAAGSCPAGTVATIKFMYMMKGISYQGGVCLPTLPSTTSFGELYFYNVNSCQNGYYVMKTGSQMPSYKTTGPNFELILCGQCHPNCSTCFDYSAYTCTSCPTGKVLYMSTCITACPAGYTADVAFICQPNTCSILTYLYVTAGPVNNCVKFCPSGFFANNNTWTCDACHSDCKECWGATSSDCRVCSTANGGYAYGNGSCVPCASGSYIDDHSNFNCSNYTMYTKMDKMAASAPATDPELTGVTIADTMTNAAVAVSVDTSSYLAVPSKDQAIKLPEIKYTGTRTCYRYLIEMDIFLGTSALSWHNIKLSVTDSSAEIVTLPINKWNFETALGAFNPTTTFTQYRAFYNNTNCTKKSVTLTIGNNLTAAATWGIRNLRTYWYHCPLDCISCLSSISCERCVEGKFFYVPPIECQVPYTSLDPNPEQIAKTYSFLFKPNSVYIYFNKAMNFSLGDKFPYFFPTFTKSTSRLLQTSSSDAITTAEVKFVGNNFMELLISDLQTSSDITGTYTFRYPLVDQDRVGYNFTSLSVTYLTNYPSATLLVTYIRILSENKFIVRLVMTGVIFFLLWAMGANWLMVENLQKLYLILFFSLTYSYDMDLLFDLMDFSFFGWFQLLPELIFGPDSYWDYVKYDDYISQYDKSRSITKEFLNYIPPRKMGKYLVRKSFPLHTFHMLLIVGFFGLLFAIMKPIRFWILKKYYYKEKLVAVINYLDSFLHFRFFVRFIMITFIPFAFYGLSNISNIEMSKPKGLVSAICCFVVLGIWGFSMVQYFVVAFFVPTEQELKNVIVGWKSHLVIPFVEFMRYYKNPDDPFSVRQRTEEDENDGKGKADFDKNEHMVIKESTAVNEVYTLSKDQLKKGGAQVYKKEDEEFQNVKNKKDKKKQPGFIPISKVLEMEKKEQEKKNKEKEAQKEKEEKKKLKDEEKSKKDGKDDKGDKGEKKDGDNKSSSSSSSSSSDDEKKSNDSKDDKKKDKKDGKDKDSSDSSDDSNTQDSEDDTMVGTNVHHIGRLLGRAAAKFEKGPGCCECACIRKNRKIIKFNYFMEKTAKFYSLVRIAHMGLMCALIWYFGESPFLQVIIFSSSQTVFFLWTILCRPYIYLMMNISLIFVEFCFTGLAWLMFLLQNPAMSGMKDIFYLIALLLGVCVFVASVFTFLAFLMTSIVKKLSSLGSKDPL
jgi:hypothetical protein